MPKPTQETLELGYKTAFGLEDFFVTSSNQDATYWLENYENWVNKMLVIYGSKGCGKTHMANIFAKSLDGESVIISYEMLTIENVIDIISSYNVIVVDGADKVVDEEAFFHLYNMAKEEGVYLLLTANAPPARWNIKLADLESRLSTITAVGIKEPDDALIMAILVKMFADRQIKIKKEVIDYILKNLERSFNKLSDLVAKADKRSLSLKKPITIPLIREILQEN